MADISEIPALVREFYELSKAYLIQETVEPAKRLGHFSGYSLGAAVIWAAAVVLLAVAGLRALYDVLPPGPYWEALAYMVFALLLVLFMVLLVKLAPVPDPRETYGDSKQEGER